MFRRHFPQGAIKRFRPEKERCVQQRAIHLALQYARIDQRNKCLEEHFADAIKTLRERLGFPRELCWCKPQHHLAIGSIVAMTDNEALRQGIAHLPDADLQGAAVAHQSGRVKPDGVFRIGDRLRWRSKQREVGFGAVEHRVKLIAGQITLPRHERKFGVHLRHDLEGDAAIRTRTHQVKRRIGVAAQAIARLAIHDALGDKLRDHIDAASQQI